MDKQVPRSGKKVTIKHVPAKVPSHVVSKRSAESSPSVSTPFSGLRQKLNLGNVPETPFESYKTPLSTTKTLRDRLREKYGDDLSPVGAMQKKLENIKPETIADQKDEAIETLTECIAQVSTQEDHTTTAREDATPEQFKTPYSDTFKIALQKTMPSIRSARAKEQRMTELINAHKNGHKKTVSKVVGDIETIVAPFMMENELPKSRRTQNLVDYILSLADTPAGSPEAEAEPNTPEALKTLKSPEREVFMTPAQEFKGSNVENESVENLMKSPTNAKKYAICSIDGAFATAFTPVRVTKQKDREKLGVQYAVSPVRRSARGLSSKTTQELWKDGFEQVGDVGELLQETGYAYVANKALDL